LVFAHPKLTVGDSNAYYSVFARRRFLHRVPFEVKIDPKLAESDRVLGDSKLVLMVTNDLFKSAPQAAWNGYLSTPVEVTLRSTVVRSLMTWSYRVMEEEINGSMTWAGSVGLMGARCRIIAHSETARHSADWRRCIG
jgi:hypothetical protein